MRVAPRARLRVRARARAWARARARAYTFRYAGGDAGELVRDVLPVPRLQSRSVRVRAPARSLAASSPSVPARRRGLLACEARSQSHPTSRRCLNEYGGDCDLTVEVGARWDGGVGACSSPLAMTKRSPLVRSREVCCPRAALPSSTRGVPPARRRAAGRGICRCDARSIPEALLEALPKTFLEVLLELVLAMEPPCCPTKNGTARGNSGWNRRRAMVGARAHLGRGR